MGNRIQHKILIVEDQSDLRQLVCMTLLPEGHQLLEADNGMHALELVASKRPDLVLLDVMLPGVLNGLQVCARIKSSPVLAATRVILLTAKGQAADREEGRKAGADAYFVKPFSPLELLEQVRKMLA